MYITEIIWFLTWPGLIFVSYLAIRWALKRFESKIEQE
jgi:hypothetical protein